MSALQPPKTGVAEQGTAQSRKRFSLIAFVSLGIMLWLWWVAADVPIATTHATVQWLGQSMGLVKRIDASSGKVWEVTTNLWVLSGPANMQGQFVAFSVTTGELRFALRSVPIFLALMLAPPYVKPFFASVGTALVGLVALWGLLVASALSAVTLRVAILATGKVNPVIENFKPATFTVNGEPWSDTAFFLSGMAYYFFYFFAPLFLPVVLWALLKPEAIRMLMARLTTVIAKPA